MELTPHPTVYNGIQMRSRLEARWAGFFDALGLRWQYEPIELNGWIPDFVVEDIPGIKPYHAVGTEYGEKKHKPYLVEIKPLNVNGCEQAYAPRDVTDKIEDALGCPRTHGKTQAERDALYERHPQGSSSLEQWDAFFDDLPYQPLLLGSDPLNAWLFQRTAGWWRVSGYAFGGNCELMNGECRCEGDMLPRCAVEQPFLPNWRELWTHAGNGTQYKAPMPQDGKAFKQITSVKPVVVPQADDGWVRGAWGSVMYGSPQNVRRALQIAGVEIRHNTFTHDAELKKADWNDWRPMSEVGNDMRDLVISMINKMNAPG